MNRNFIVNGSRRLLQGALLCSTLSLVVVGFGGCGDDSGSGASAEVENNNQNGDWNPLADKTSKGKNTGKSSSSSADTSFWGGKSIKG